MCRIRRTISASRSTSAGHGVLESVVPARPALCTRSRTISGGQPRRLPGHRARPLWRMSHTAQSSGGECYRGGTHGTWRADDSEPLRDAAVAGLGVVLIPTWLAGEEIKAVRLRHALPQWSSMINTKPSGIFGIFPSASRGATEAVRMFNYP